jgi:hypothetical protein
VNRYNTDAEIPKRTPCFLCGERKSRVTASCECYDEDRQYCRPEHPNSLCPNGLPMCNGCASCD